MILNSVMTADACYFCSSSELRVSINRQLPSFSNFVAWGICIACVSYARRRAVVDTSVGLHTYHAKHLFLLLQISRHTVAFKRGQLVLQPQFLGLLCVHTNEDTHS